MRETLRFLLISMFVCGALMGCGKEAVDTDFSNLLSQSEKATVFLYSGDSSEPYERVRDLDKQDLKELADMVLVSDEPKRICNYDGAIFFYNEEEIIMKMRFSLDQQCASGIYPTDGRISTKNISVKGLDLLREKLALRN